MPPAVKSTPAVENMTVLNPHAAGIDVGAAMHYVAVPAGSDPQGRTIRCFPAFTRDLRELVDWLKVCAVDTVAMESTGVYWIPLMQMIERNSIKGILVDARHTKNLACRKSDVSDCEWIRQLHSNGLLRPAFRPDKEITALRCLVRQRARIVNFSGTSIQLMQKALNQMNLQLQHVISDISGTTGLRIISSIVGVVEDPGILAELRDRRCKQSKENIAKALQGDYVPEHVFALRLAYQQFQFQQSQISQCSATIHDRLAGITKPLPVRLLPPPRTKRRSKHQAPNVDPHELRYSLCQLAHGVDLTTIPGISDQAALTVLSEIGCDMSRFRTAHHFASWLGVAPGCKISGGRVLSSRTKRSTNHAAMTLRMCAQSLSRHQSDLGNFFRRMRARMGGAAAITATAHKLARIIYTMLKNRVQYAAPGPDRQSLKRDATQLRKAAQTAHKMGFMLVPMPIQEVQAGPT